MTRRVQLSLRQVSYVLVASDPDGQVHMEIHGTILASILTSCVTLGNSLKASGNQFPQRNGKLKYVGDIPGGLVAKTPQFYCSGQGFHHCLGN